MLRGASGILEGNRSLLVVTPHLATSTRFEYRVVTRHVRICAKSLRFFCSTDHRAAAGDIPTGRFTGRAQDCCVKSCPLRFSAIHQTAGHISPAEIR